RTHHRNPGTDPRLIRTPHPAERRASPARRPTQPARRYPRTEAPKLATTPSSLFASVTATCFCHCERSEAISFVRAELVEGLTYCPLPRLRREGRVGGSS